MITVAVLMSSYNGARYIKEQIDSVLAQEGVNVSLVVRDDGSSDNTPDILKQYEKDNKIAWYTGANLKPLGSFMHLLFHCEHADYYAFCDQDDVWLSSKLVDSLKVMQRNEIRTPHAPVIVHTDMTVVDNELNTMNKSFWDCDGIRPDILNNFIDLACYNGVNGCTILMNNQARDLIKEKYFEQTWFIHDVMCSLIVSANGGIIDYVDKPLVLYRQHGGNVVGADKEIKYRYFKRLKIIIPVIRNNFKNFVAVNQIGKVGLFDYLYHKIKYIFTKKHGIRI